MTRTCFVLLIAINQYDSPEIGDLRGAVADAHAMKGFLVEDVGVPENRIQELYDTHATSENIKSAILGLSEDARIQPGDSILIYYAGHGSEVPSLQPALIASKIQMIIPHDFNPKTTQSQGILDYIFSGWLTKVAKFKGDNIVSSGHQNRMNWYIVTISVRR
jgi:uncharacterized caspase-like protein